MAQWCDGVGGLPDPGPTHRVGNEQVGDFLTCTVGVGGGGGCKNNTRPCS